MESETSVWGIHTSSPQVLRGAFPKAHHVNVQEWYIGIPSCKQGESAASTSQEKVLSQVTKYLVRKFQ